MTDVSQALQGSMNASDDQTGTKRKRDENGTPPQRGKRNRYISIACNECKRRKIKCNGESPCQRCGNLKLECVYAPNCCTSNVKDSEDYKDLNNQVQSLQAQVDALTQNITALRATLGQDDFVSQNAYYDDEAAQSQAAPQLEMAIDPALQSREHSLPKRPHFQGPTSSEYSLGIARSSLRTMGIEGGLEEAGNGQRDAVIMPPGGSDRREEKDPIWSVNKDEALRLCRVYDEEMGSLYPVLDIDKVTRHATLLFTFMDALTRNDRMFLLSPGYESMQDEETDVLKIVMAIAMVVEETGSSVLGKRLIKSVSSTADSRLMGNVTLKDIQILTLIAMYHFHTDDEGLSWRVIGLAARLCIELGLHRRETYNKMANEDDRMAAIKLFWSIYTLDRRWSFGTGMSFALQDSDIDPNLPKPNETSPYLIAMIAYSTIASKVWKSIASADISPSSGVKPISNDEVDFLDYQILQWQRTLPASLRFIHPSSPEFARHASDPNAADTRALFRQRVVLYLRANQMRISIYRPFLHSQPSTVAVQGQPHHAAEIVTGIARDTIQVLTHTNATSDIYRSQQMMFNHFLLSAMAVIFLAVSHAPSLFAESCREEFYMAIELVRGLSKDSVVSRRLWRMIKGMREVAPKLGLLEGEAGDASAGQRLSVGNANTAGALVQHPRTTSTSRTQPQHQREDPHSSAAMTMAGLAGHKIDESILYSLPNFSNSTTITNANANTTTTPQINSNSNSITNSNTTGNPAAPASNNMPFTPSSGMSVLSPGGMALELTSLFEAAGDGFQGFFGNGGVAGMSGMGMGGEDELGRIMRDLF